MLSCSADGAILHALYLAAPAAASFYVPTLPGLTQDPNHPINIYAGHLPSDPSGSIPTPAKKLIEHLYFVLLKSRWSADKERLVIWLNVGIPSFYKLL